MIKFQQSKGVRFVEIWSHWAFHVAKRSVMPAHAKVLGTCPRRSRAVSAWPTSGCKDKVTWV